MEATKSRENIQLSPLRIWCCENHTNTHTYSRFSIVVCENFSPVIVESQETGKFEFFSSFSFSGEHSLSHNNFFQLYKYMQYVGERKKQVIYINYWLTHHSPHDPHNATYLSPMHTSHCDFVWFRIPTLYLLSLMFYGKAFGFWNKINQFATIDDAWWCLEVLNLFIDNFNGKLKSIFLSFIFYFIFIKPITH